MHACAALLTSRCALPQSLPAAAEGLSLYSSPLTSCIQCLGIYVSRAGAGGVLLQDQSPQEAPVLMYYICHSQIHHVYPVSTNPPVCCAEACHQLKCVLCIWVMFCAATAQYVFCCGCVPGWSVWGVLCPTHRQHTVCV